MCVTHRERTAGGAFKDMGENMRREKTPRSTGMRIAGLAFVSLLLMPLSGCTAA